MPDEFNQPMWSDDEVETIAWACVIDKVKPDMVIRIAVATIYGGRIGELCQLTSGDIHLDGENSYIYLKTEKKGMRKKQPIPPSLIPLFRPRIEACSGPSLHNKLKAIVKRAGVPWPRGSGFHSLRRGVVTVIDPINQSDIAKHKFMGWAVPRHLGMLDRYRQIPTEVSDRIILQQHPRVKMWERILPFLIDCNPHYRSQIDILA
jgi:integrase